MATSLTNRTKAFISYSHKDMKLLDELHEHLAQFEKQGLIQYWDDRKLTPGVDWRDEIGQAIKAAKVAILLVSPSFLASDFITTEEVPLLLDAAKNEGAILLSVIARPCMFRQTALAQLQAVNDPTRPLSDLTRSKRDQVWARSAEHTSELQSHSFI